MVTADPPALAGLLDAHREEIVQQWMHQLKNDGAPSSRMREDELQAQCSGFIARLRDAWASGSFDVDAEAFAGLREMLSDLSATRATHGCSARETALFVFSLKQPLFDAVQAHGNTRAAAQLQPYRTIDLMLDRLGLLAIEADHKAREALIVRQQKMAAVGQLTGSIAHDFNNILGSMTGWIHLARRKSGDGEIATMLDKALHAGERGKRLTLRLLAFTRSDARVTGAVDVRHVLLGMREWLSQTVGSGIALDVKVPDRALVAVTDANQLELALLNLVIHARDAMPNGGRIEVDAQACRLEQPDDGLAAGDYVVVAVRDTGLGLAQAANVARLSAGAARIESRSNGGTTVALWLAAGDPAATR